MSLPYIQENAAAEGQPSPYRWAILFIAWFAFLLSFIDRLAWANVAVSVSGSLGLKVAALGVFVTAFYVGYIASNAIGGFLVDRFGGHLTLTLGVLLLGLFTFCFSYVRSVDAGIALQTLMGLAAGVDYSACIKLLTAWFGIRDRGRAFGLFLTGTSLGVAATNLIVPKLLKGFGWGAVYQGLGATTMAFGIIIFRVLRDAPSSARERSVDRPNFAALLHNRDLLFLAAAGFGALWGTWGVAFWANALLIKGHGFSAEEAGLVVALFGIGAVIAKPIVGLISDWRGICNGAYQCLLATRQRNRTVSRGSRLSRVELLLRRVRYARRRTSVGRLCYVAGARIESKRPPIERGMEHDQCKQLIEHRTRAI